MQLRTIFIKIFCGLAPGFLPVIHILILYLFWGKYSRRVDKRYCSCSCWDTVFKGTYETGIGSYKHMYFNATSNSIKIWLTTVTLMSIALIHILAGGVDQFIVNIFYGEGDTHQILRDLAFIVPDILHLILPIVQYYNYHKGQIHLHNFKNDIILMFFLTFFGFFLCYIL
ncbi:hypothetical protein Phum_PHUM104050 [Pediculus humanus corporis]|uniref:Uncharacterized protein n=1 Tax=Pediculus humanus subsp. corporis TaxID=121224 RepID=E0VD21_PEDHC|nr:uncharacterized protein Phum_PHUM104050 [Pediculus humanus corporis]EEB11277.1 hypothetical protein Phum_PHUM104050 [Pediculus humanus corporis]